MKKLLAILVLGIGIVLSIPKSVQAVNTCDFNAADGDAIYGSYGFKNKIHYCNDNDIMEINANMQRKWALVDMNNGPADNVFVTIF